MVDIVDMLPGPRGGHLPGGDALERGLYLQRHDDVPLQCALQVRQLPPGQQGTGVVKVGIKTKTTFHFRELTLQLTVNKIGGTTATCE